MNLMWKSIEEFRYRNSFKLILNTDDQLLTVYLNNEIILDKQWYRMEDCGTPHILLGPYRYGSNVLKNETSVVDFDKIQINELK